MVIPSPVRPPRISQFLMPYILKIQLTNSHVCAQIIHTPTGTVACSASSQEKVLGPSMESTGGITAAAKIGKILGERLLFRRIPAVFLSLNKDQEYRGKVKTLIDSLKDTGVKLL